MIWITASLASAILAAATGLLTPVTAGLALLGQTWGKIAISKPTHLYYPFAHAKTGFAMAMTLLLPVVTVVHLVKFARCFVCSPTEVILRFSCCGRPAPMPTVC